MLYPLCRTQRVLDSSLMTPFFFFLPQTLSCASSRPPPEVGTLYFSTLLPPSAYLPERETRYVHINIMLLDPAAAQDRACSSKTYYSQCAFLWYCSRTHVHLFLHTYVCMLKNTIHRVTTFLQRTDTVTCV